MPLTVINVPPVGLFYLNGSALSYYSGSDAMTEPQLALALSRGENVTTPATATTTAAAAVTLTTSKDCVAQGVGSSSVLSDDDRRRVQAYLMTACDELADVDLVYELCFKIHATQAPG